MKCANIADVIYSASALGAPYPLNILTVHSMLNLTKYLNIEVSRSIGEKQHDRALACQAALGVATTGVDIVNCGLAGFPFEVATYLYNNL
ncbi:(5-formylfuran-3-yl)methyl phosphate synthase [bacterium]